MPHAYLGQNQIPCHPARLRPPSGRFLSQGPSLCKQLHEPLSCPLGAWKPPCFVGAPHPGQLVTRFAQLLDASQMSPRPPRRPPPPRPRPPHIEPSHRHCPFLAAASSWAPPVPEVTHAAHQGPRPILPSITETRHGHKREAHLYIFKHFTIFGNVTTRLTNHSRKTGFSAKHAPPT